jgi:hypothetical protein
MAMTAKQKKEAEAQAAKAVSLNPDDMAEGGGLLDNIRATITDAKFVMTNYQGKSQIMRPAAHLTLTEIVDGEELVHDDQFWSCGKAEDWMPSDDGKYLIPTGMKKQIHKSSNFGMFLVSALDCGFPGDKFDSDISFLIGTEAHFHQIVVADRGKTKTKDGKEYDAQVMCLAEIFKFPWEKAKGKSAKTSGKQSKGKGKGKAKAEPEADDGADLNADAQAIIMELLVEAGGEMAKKDLASKIMQHQKDAGGDQKTTNQMLKLAFNDEYLGGDDQPWTYEDGVLTM